MIEFDTYHLPPTSAMNLAYNRVSFWFFIPAMEKRMAKLIIMNITEKKNLIKYEEFVVDCNYIISYLQVSLKWNGLLFFDALQIYPKWQF